MSKRTIDEFLKDQKEDHTTQAPVKKQRIISSESKAIIQPEQKIDEKEEPYLVTFDTEINGWRKYDEKGNKLDVDPQSRITQIAWSLFTKNGKLIQTKSEYIKPMKWAVDESQMAKYGITQQLLQEKGVLIHQVFDDFIVDLKSVSQNNGTIGCHKFRYDSKLVLEEAKRISSDTFNCLNKILQDINKIDTFNLDLLKTLHQNDNFIQDFNQKKIENEKIARQLKYYESKKWGPQLGVLHDFLCGTGKSQNAHDAAVDAEMCGEVIFAIKHKYHINLLIQ